MEKEYPQVGVPFRLKHSKDLEDMPRRFGYDSTGWNYQGETLTDGQEGLFMLVRPDYTYLMSSLPNAKKVLEAQYGPMPACLWLGDFLNEYPRSNDIGDDSGLVGIADASFVDSHQCARFPHVRSTGRPFFYFADGTLGKLWRWIVFAQEVKKVS